jgi:hypothetical protein
MKNKEIRNKRKQSIKELGIPSHSFFMTSTFFKASWKIASLCSSASIT